MLKFFVILLILMLQECLAVSDECSLQYKAVARDGISCYECGRSGLNSNNMKPFTDIYSRSGANPEVFPWHATIFKNWEDGWSHICGGTLVSSLVVITAAHCVSPYQSSSFFDTPETSVEPHKFKIYLGMDHLLVINGSHREIMRQVKEIRVHPDYKGGNDLPSQVYASDIALVFLDIKVPFSRYVMPACLDFSLKELPAFSNNNIGYTAGFGHTHKVNADMCTFKDDVLKYIVVQMMTFNDCCNALHRQLGINGGDSSNFLLTPDKFCVRVPPLNREDYNSGRSKVTSIAEVLLSKTEDLPEPLAPFQKGHGGDGVTKIYRGLHYITGLGSVKLMKRTRRPIRYGFSSVTNITNYMSWIINNLPEEE